jgi:anti-repressor protein
MTNEIIKINYDNDRPTVTGRQLHEALEVKTAYKDWFPRMCEYGFTENVDFSSILSESTGGRPSTDHQLTIEMAKEICMLQRTEIGKRCRQYFIELEKAWNTPELVMARALKLANHQIECLQYKLDEQKPLVEFATKVSDTSSLIDMAQMAKLLHDENIKIGRNKLFKWLQKNDILRSNNEPYQQYVNNGYFKVKEYTYNTPYGEKIGIKTYVTGKGQIYITEKLRKEYNI